LIWSFPLYNLSAVIGFHLQGLADVSRLTQASVTTTVFAVIFLIPVTIAYGLTGAIASVLATSIAQTLIYVFELRRE